METKSKIMNSAFELFAKNGISFTLTEVAKEVGIKKASIYAHFENKDMLLCDVINEEINKYFFEINQEHDELKRIFFSVLDYYNLSHTKLLFWKRLLLLPPDSINPDLLNKIQCMSDDRYKIVTQLILIDISAGNIKAAYSEEEICLMFFSLIHGLLSSVLIYPQQNIKQHYINIWNIFWNSIVEI